MLAAVYLARFCRRVALFDHGKPRARWMCSAVLRR
jgi:hypothetical protein